MTRQGGPPPIPALPHALYSAAALLFCGLAGVAAAVVYRTQLPAIGRAIRPVYEKLGT